MVSEKCALKTLATILSYRVDVKIFNLGGIARCLGREKERLKDELVWLVKEGYFIELPNGSLKITQKGIMYGHDDPCEDDEPEVVEVKKEKSPEDNSGDFLSDQYFLYRVADLE